MTVGNDERLIVCLAERVVDGLLDGFYLLITTLRDATADLKTHLYITLQCQGHSTKIQHKLISRYEYDDKDGNSKSESYKDYPLIPSKNQAF